MLIGAFLQPPPIFSFFFLVLIMSILQSFLISLEIADVSISTLWDHFERVFQERFVWAMCLMALSLAVQPCYSAHLERIYSHS